MRPLALLAGVLIFWREMSDLTHPANLDVKEGDPDRWAAAQFAPHVVRSHLLALYAFNLEVSRATDPTSEPVFAQMRLKWWEEQIAGLCERRIVSNHPLFVRLMALFDSYPGVDALLSKSIAARSVEVEDIPFDTPGARDLFLRDTSGALLQCAAMLCGASPSLSGRLAIGGVAWGRVGLLRSHDWWKPRRRDLKPASVSEKDRNDWFSNEVEAAEQELQLFRVILREERRTAVNLMPAFAYLTLLEREIRGLRSGAQTSVRRSLFSRRFKIFLAAAGSHI
jgi:phytoene/squalene synthetase